MRSSLLYALFALVLFATTWGLTAAPRKEPASEVLAVQTIPVKTVLTRPKLVLSGRVEPERSAVLTAQVSAPVHLRLKQLGDRVSQGEAILLLDPEQARLQSQQALAALDQARSGYLRVQADLRHTQALVTSQEKSSRASLASASAARQKQVHLTRPQELASARQDWQAARSQSNQSQREWQRLEMLWKEGAISDQEVERARLALDLARRREISSHQSYSLAREGARREDRLGAQASLQTARAGLELAQAGPLRVQSLQGQLGESAALIERQQAAWEESRVQLERHQIRAPFAGRVLEITAEEGDAVRPGTVLCRIGQVDRVKVRFDVPEQVRPQLRQQQSVQLQCSALPGQIFNGQIRHLGYQADPQSHTFPVEVGLSNPAQRLLPNMLVRLEVAVGPGTHQILVPVSSLAFDGGLAYVYVIEGGIARRREVVVGRLEGDRIALEEGVKAGDRVAVQPFRLSPGVAVQSL